MTQPLTLQKHLRKWEPCNLCPIASTHKVFYRSNQMPHCRCRRCRESNVPFMIGTPVDYLFIGDSPSASDTITRHPFTGTTGKLLEELLREAKVPSWGLTHIISCFPCKDRSKTTPRTPLVAEVESCRSRLDEIVEVVEARRYIALGKTAKKNPPPGVTYHLELDHPQYISRRGGIKSITFKRNKHKLAKFINEEEAKKEKAEA